MPTMTLSRTPAQVPTTQGARVNEAVQLRLPFDIEQWARNVVLAYPAEKPAEPSSYEVTWSDYYCGAGGSSSGIELVLGAKVVLAANHWDLAVLTHQHNMPHADHDIADITGLDPRRHPRTDFAWFSPECTTWSMARGLGCDYDGEDGSEIVDGYMGDGSDGDDPERPVSKQALIRSRVQMRDVWRFARVHQYRGIIVENVPDIMKWGNLDRWLRDMVKLGYKYKMLVLNSAFAHGLGAPAPQLRDRWFCMFWKAEYRTPNFDKWLRPYAWCASCETVVRGVFTAKPGPRRPMRYGKNAQYFYRCPRKCESESVQPFILPASSAIDLRKPIQRIGDRKRPLADKTRARIAAGLRKYGRPITAEVAGNTFERRPGVRTWPVDSPMTVQTTTSTKAVAHPPMLVPVGGTWNDDAYPITDAMRTRTTRENEAVAVPPMTLSTTGREGSGRARPVSEPFPTQTARHEGAVLYVPLRNNGNATPVDQAPVQTFTAGGTHHAVVMRNNHGAGEMSTPLTEPIRTLTTAGHQSVVAWEGGGVVMRNTTPRAGESRCTPLSEPLRTLVAGGGGGGQSFLGWEGPGLYTYDSGAMRPLTEPLPTQTTVDGDAVIDLGVEVDDCYLRMLDVDEIHDGMAFLPDFELLGTAKRDKVKMLGNAVTPPCARDLAACLMEAVLGHDYEVTPFGYAMAG